ncbi:MAG: hypothetical protein ACK4YU_14795, partial [Paracoccus sp. (in: a-proteobacteria)]
MEAIGHREQLTDAQYAAIGRAVRGFAVLEHALASATISLLGGPEFDPDTIGERQAQGVVQARFDARLNRFLIAYGEKFQRDLWCDRLEEAVKGILKWRNGICHGLWSNGADGEMVLTFWDRESAAEFREATPQSLTIEDLY